MSVSIALTPLTVFAVFYSVVALMFLSAAVVERLAYANPDYTEAVLVAVFWPLLPLQILYTKATGRYLVNDIGSLREKI